MPKLTDQQIISYLQSGKAADEDLACQFLYEKYYGLVESMVVKNDFAKNSTSDIFQDTVVILWKMANKNGFTLSSTVKTLLYSIAFNQLRNRLRHRGRTVELKAEQEMIPIVDAQLERLVRSEKNNLVLSLLRTLGKDCQKVLQLFYYQQLTMKKIQTAFGDKSEAVTKNRKSRCLQRIREKVLGNQQLLTAFKNG